MNNPDGERVSFLAVFFIAVGFIMSGCGIGEKTITSPVPPTPEKLASQPFSPTPTSIPSSTFTPQSTFTLTVPPTSTSTPSPIPIFFAETPVLPISSLPQDQSGEYPPLELLWEWKFPPKWNSSLIFSPDTSKFFYSYGLSIRVVDISSPQLLNELAFNKESMPYNFSISPDGKRLSTDDSMSILVIDLEGKTIQKKMKAFLFDVWMTQFSPDGRLLLGVDYYDNAIIWDTDTWEETSRISFPARSYGPWWMSDGKRLVLDNGRGIVYLYDLTGQEVGSVEIGTHGMYYFAGDGEVKPGYLELETDQTVLIYDGDGQNLGSVKFKLEIEEEIKGREPDHRITTIQFYNPAGHEVGVVRRDGTGTFHFKNEILEELAMARLEEGIVTLTSTSGEWIGAFRVVEYSAGQIGYPVQMLNSEGEVTDEFLAEHRRLLSPLPNGSLAVLGSDGIRCMDIQTETFTCFVQIPESNKKYSLVSEIAAVILFDQKNRLKVIDLGTGDEIYESQEFQISEIKGGVISPNKAIIGMIIEKPDENNRYLQLWGLLSDQP